MHYNSNSTNNEDQIFAEHEWINIVMTVTSSLSMFGSISIIVTYFLFENLRNTSRKILVYISIGDFFTVFPYLVIKWTTYPNNYSHSLNCQVQSFVTTTAVMWSFFWTSSLAIYLYFSVVKKRVEMAEKLMVLFHVINWGVPLILVGVAQWQQALGFLGVETSGGWCWIKRQNEHWKTVLWMLACGKFCEIASYFVDGILCFCVYRKIKEELVDRSHMSDESVQAGEQGLKKLAFAPILFILLRMWGTIRFFIFCSKKHVNDMTGEHMLLVLHIIGDTSQGFVNFILFCLCTKRFRENFSRICGHRENRTEPAQYINSSTPERKYILKPSKRSTDFYT